MKHGRLMLGIIIAFIIIDSILFFFLSAKTSKTSIVFVSLKPGYSWDIEKPKKEEFENKLIEAGANTGKILVVMSADDKKTTSGTGWGDGEPAYYGEWKTVAGYEVLTIYTDEAELAKVPEEYKTKILKLFITREISQKKNTLDRVDATSQI